MDYRKVYMEIIKKARNRPLTKEKGYEIHHILPKSIFPNWSKRKGNMVKLTYKEHFFCHELLTKIYPSSKLNFALLSMSNSKKYRKTLTLKQYEILKSSIDYSGRSEKMKKKWQNTEFREKVTKAVRNTKEIRSEKMKEKWKDSSYSEKVKKSLKKSQNSRTEKFKKWAAENHKVLSEKRKEYLKANPEAKYSLNKFREENPNFYKELWAKPEMKEKRSKTMTNFYANEENRKKQSERLKNSEKFQLATKLANGIQVRCIQTGQIFLSLADAAKWCKMKHPDRIARVCRHLSKRAGKHPETGEFLTWEFVDIGEINA